jgi:hypothetical protein
METNPDNLPKVAHGPRVVKGYMHGEHGWLLFDNEPHQWIFSTKIVPAEYML